MHVGSLKYMRVLTSLSIPIVVLFGLRPQNASPVAQVLPYSAAYASPIISFTLSGRRNTFSSVCLISCRTGGHILSTEVAMWPQWQLQIVVVSISPPSSCI